MAYTLTREQADIVGMLYNARTLGQAEGRSHTLDEIIAWLELAGEHRTAAALRRAFDHQAPGHVCALVNDECSGCGARS